MFNETTRLYDVWDTSETTQRRIGRISFLQLDSNRTGTSVSPSLGLIIPEFQYDPEWLLHGFSLGYDLPLKGGIHRPPVGERNFAFMLERELNDVALNLAEKCTSEGFFPEASLAEKRSALLPQPPQSLGAIRLTPVNFEVPLTAKTRHEAAHTILEWPLLRIAQFDSLLYAVSLLERRQETSKELALLRQSCGLPGARLNPVLLRNKVSVVLRLRAMNDPIETPFWKHFALFMAQKTGIDVVASEVIRSQGTVVMMADRFDRTPENAPRFVLSARALASRAKTTTGRPGPLSYLALADILNREGASPKRDLQALFRRLVYTHMVAGGHDHPDHWFFVRSPLGWELAPAHHLDWVSPAFMMQRSSITLDGRRPMTAVEQCVEFAPYFALTVKEAKNILLELRHELSRWEERALEQEADANDIALMAPIFDHY